MPVPIFTTESGHVRVYDCEDLKGVEQIVFEMDNLTPGQYTVLQKPNRIADFDQYLRDTYQHTIEGIGKLVEEKHVDVENGVGSAVLVPKFDYLRNSIGYVMLSDGMLHVGSIDSRFEELLTTTRQISFLQISLTVPFNHYKSTLKL